MSMRKARVRAGPYQDQIVRISNVSVDAEGRQRAAVLLPNGSRANILVSELELINESPPPEEKPRSKASMPFVSGSTGSRSLNQTKSLVRDRVTPTPKASHYVAAHCEKCGEEYNLAERRGQSGLVTLCPDCAPETP